MGHGRDGSCPEQDNAHRPQHSLAATLKLWALATSRKPSTKATFASTLVPWKRELDARESFTVRLHRGRSYHALQTSAGQNSGSHRYSVPRVLVESNRSCAASQARAIGVR